MMSRSRIKAKGRRESGAFLAIPFNVLSSDNYKKLSAKGVKLLLDVGSQIRVKQGGPVNNGDLCITESVMRDRGWNSRDSLYKARDELIYYGFLQPTRVQRYISMCALYGLTFFAINECDGKLDAPETKVPLNLWKSTKRKWKGSRQKNRSLYRYPPSVVPINGTKTHNFTKKGVA